MARVVIYLLEPEMNALNQLAQQEYRPVKSQAALIIRNELKRLGLIDEQLAGRDELHLHVVHERQHQRVSVAG